MSPIAESVVEQICELPVSERAEVAAIILDSIRQGGTPPLSQEWLDEIDARIEDLARGDVELIPVEEAMQRLRACLA